MKPLLLRILLRIPKVLELESDKQTIQCLEEYFDYFRLNSPFQKFQLATQPIIPSSGRLGFEIEMENVPNMPPPPPLWYYTEDESLRNHGAEIVSLPLPDKFIKPALYILRQFLTKIADKKPDFSWRTSVHVHCNVQELSGAQFLFLLRLYIVFEPLLYFFAGEQRQTNNFCVPLIGSSVDKILSQFFDTQHISLRNLDVLWPKYAGLSVFRLKDLGTIEYRHLPGTTDLNRLLIWSNLILSLYNSALLSNQKEIDAQILKLNSTSEYEKFFKLIFGTVIPWDNSYKSLMEMGVVFTKHCCSSNMEQCIFPIKKLSI